MRHSQSIRHVRSAANFSRESWDASVEEHGIIIAALERRDGPGLGAALRAHLRRTSSRIRASLRPL
jgi:DNA-binding GntR family transcriptional regulator